MSLERPDVFVSSDELACSAARVLDLPVTTIPDVLEAWILAATPTVSKVDELLRGMEAARFTLAPDRREGLRALARSQ